MTQEHKNFVDLTDLPFVRKEASGHPRIFFNSNHPYRRIKEELNKLNGKERSAIDLLQLFGVLAFNNNRKIAQVIRLNHDYYIPIFSSLAPEIYHPTKNRWLIFSLLAGIVSISKLEPIKLTNEIFDLVNKALVDKRKSIRRQALAGRDKTLAVFFEPEGLDALPVTLQGALYGVGLLPVTQQYILPEYRVRAASLVTRQSLAS